MRAELLASVIVYTISLDLPFAQARCQVAENVGHQALSTHKSEAFGRDYGVVLKEWRLPQRVVFVIDSTGTIVHIGYVVDQSHESDHNAALAAARRAAGRWLHLA